jgi:hypothetical protein
MRCPLASTQLRDLGRLVRWHVGCCNHRLSLHHTPEDPMPTEPEAPMTEPMETIDRDQLANVAGGARVTARGGSDDQLTLMLTQITASIKDLASNKNQSDPTQMLLLMMMMGGMGGGGGGGVIAAPAAAAGPPVINIDTSVLAGGNRFIGGFCPRGSGKKGW